VDGKSVKLPLGHFCCHGAGINCIERNGFISRGLVTISFILLCLLSFGSDESVGQGLRLSSQSHRTELQLVICTRHAVHISVCRRLVDL
jgi:hypothetical protein